MESLPDETTHIPVRKAMEPALRLWGMVIMFVGKYEKFPKKEEKELYKS